MIAFAMRKKKGEKKKKKEAMEIEETPPRGKKRKDNWGIGVQDIKQGRYMAKHQGTDSISRKSM